MHLIICGSMCLLERPPTPHYPLPVNGLWEQQAIHIGIHRGSIGMSTSELSGLVRSEVSLSEVSQLKAGG